MSLVLIAFCGRTHSDVTVPLPDNGNLDDRRKSG